MKSAIKLTVWERLLLREVIEASVNGDTYQCAAGSKEEKALLRMAKVGLTKWRRWVSVREPNQTFEFRAEEILLEECGGG